MSKILTIIVPVYNEINTINIVISRLKKLKLYKKFNKQIIIVDDCSTDGTQEYLRKLKKKLKNFKFIFKNKNMGKGHSQKLCKNVAKGDFIVIHDADLEYNPKDLNKLLKVAINQKKEFVIGYRNLKVSLKHPYFFLRETVVNFMSLLINILYRSNIKDCSCCHRLFSKRIWKKINPKGNRFEYDYSIICQALLLAKSAGQCPISYSSRSFDEGKKNSWYVAIQAVKRIILDRFTF
tara:strand:+ start:563 stop:1270 length:708 start_codon:yes stop_codon:yes gene_type:complete